MHFSHPIVFCYLLLIPVLLVGAILATRARSTGWKKLVGSRLRHSLVRESPTVRRWVSFALGLLAFAFLITTLTIPHAGHREETEIVRGRNILLAIDVSRSMLAKDESPNRLTAARAAALEVLELFPNDRIGLIAFSGGPWLQAPLTIDHSALVETLQQLDAETLPRGGSDLSEAVKLALETFKQTGQQNNALIVFSDGEAHDGDAARAARNAAEADLTIYTIGFGTEEGSFLPDPKRPGERLRDRNGNLIFTQLKREDLQLLASRTGGFYTQGSGRQLSQSLQAAVDRMDRSESEGGQRRIPIHRFQWFLLPAMILLILSLLTNTAWRLCRRGAVAALAFGLLPEALEARILPPTAAENALVEKDYERALKLFDAASEEATGERLARLKLGEGAAAYHSGHYSRALASYTAALLSENPAVQTEAHYALGNALYLQGISLLKNGEQGPSKEALAGALSRLQDSLVHYDQSLALAQTHPNAQANRAHVEKVLETLKQEQQQQQEQEESEPKNDESQEGGDSEEQKDNPEESPPDENQENESSGNEDQPPPPQDGEGEEQDQGEQGTENENETQQPPPPQPGEAQSQGADSEAVAGNPPPGSPEPGSPEEDPRESPEERARRILEENADFQTAPLAHRHLKQPRTDKDW